MSKFKVGDVVRLAQSYGGVPIHALGTVAETFPHAHNIDQDLLDIEMEDGTELSIYAKRVILEKSDVDVVNNPSHYTQHPSGVECIQITEHMNFNLGNALKYIWRADLKGKAVEDLKKAEFYIKRELKRLDKQGKV